MRYPLSHHDQDRQYVAGQKNQLPTRQRKTLMDPAEFLAENDTIDTIEILSFSAFPPRLLPPRFAGLIGRDRRTIYLTTEMRDIHERLEIGVLKSWERDDPSTAASKVRLSGGRVLQWNYLAVPDHNFISGMRIEFDTGELYVTAGAWPLSVFVAFGDFRTEGAPEFPLVEYRAIEGLIERFQ